MARFDEVFAELQAKMGAAIAVITQYPEVAAEVRAAIETAKTEAEIAEDRAQDDARANALHNVILGVRQTLAEAAPDAVVVDPSVVEQAADEQVVPTDDAAVSDPDPAPIDAGGTGS